MLAHPLDTGSFALVNVSPYSVEALQAATHDSDLGAGGGKEGKEREEREEEEMGREGEGGLVHVILDHRHMGVGGDDSWSPSVHPEYHVPCKEYSFGVRFAFKPNERANEI